MNGSEYARDLGFGSGANRSKFEEDGTLKFEGDATVWDDVVGSLIGKNLSDNTGSVDYNWVENTITFAPNGDIDTSADLVNFNVQIPHGTKLNSIADLHLHWEQIDDVPREFTVRHRIQNNGQAKTIAWTESIVSTATDAKFAYSTGILNQISDLVDIDLNGIGISSVIQFQVTRTDAIAGDIEVTFMDVHVEKDTIGSRLEYVK